MKVKIRLTIFQTSVKLLKALTHWCHWAAFYTKTEWLTEPSSLWITGTCQGIISDRHVRASPKQRPGVHAPRITTRWQSQATCTRGAQSRTSIHGYRAAHTNRTEPDTRLNQFTVKATARNRVRLGCRPLRPSGKDWAEFPGFSFQGTIKRSSSHHDHPAKSSIRGEATPTRVFLT